MISKSPEQQMQYEARLKFQLDEAAKLDFARTEGVQKGILIGSIRLLQKLLGVPQSDTEELYQSEGVSLAEMAEHLEQQLGRSGA